MSHQDLVLTHDQAKAFDQIQQFLIDPERTSCILDGPAGSGKTSLLRHLKTHLGGRVVITAPTNKAVAVLREKGFDQATTLDKVLNKSIYTPTSRPPTQQEIQFYKEHELDIPEFFLEEHFEKMPADGEGMVVCLDESSMTNEAEFTRLVNEYPKVIAVGDGFQLPPVEGNIWFQIAEPDIRLVEIVRTGKTSEITSLVNLIRRKSPEWKKKNWNSEVTILKRHERTAVDRAIQTSDVTLAAKNATCDEFNFRIRDLRELFKDDTNWEMPSKGDKLLAWENIKGSKNRPGIHKSEIYTVVRSFPLNGGYRVQIEERDEYIAISKANLREQKTEITVEGLNRFSYGHCITGHKSQGSEWDNVVVLAFDKWNQHDDYWSWLYTSCSRAKKHLTVVI